MGKNIINGKKYNRCYLLKLSFYDYSIVKSYVADGDFLIYKGICKTGMVAYLLDNRKNGSRLKYGI